MANSFRTQGVDAELLRSGETVTVVDRPTELDLLPVRSAVGTALLFLCGGGIHRHAYVPLLRPVAEAGYPVFIVALPYRFAPLRSHKEEAVRRSRSVIASHSEVSHWVVAGHSLGGALAARLAVQLTGAERGLDVSYVLIGTTHPKKRDLSALEAPFVKVYATRDGVAPAERVLANRPLLPADTEWVEIEGGNHSQFGHYGHQLLDGRASISRDEQQALTRQVLLATLGRHDANGGGER